LLPAAILLVSLGFIHTVSSDGGYCIREFEESSEFY
jgi:hypothetical protein